MVAPRAVRVLNPPEMALTPRFSACWRARRQTTGLWILQILTSPGNARPEPASRCSGVLIFKVTLSGRFPAALSSWCYDLSSAKRKVKDDVKHESESELSVRLAAAALGITVDATYRAVWNGRLPARKVGRELWIQRAAVEQYRSEHAARLRAQLDRLQESAAAV
jgi:excisionase family DNA binding protein